MKLAYVTTYKASNIHAWSGLGYHILRALQNDDFQTECIGPLKERYFLYTKAKTLFYRTVLSKRYNRDREPIQLIDYANQVQKHLKLINCDLVFSPGTIPIAYLKTDKPIIFWTDATFAGMKDFYPGGSNLCQETIRDGNKMEQLALSKCQLAIYSSKWAAETAVENYDVDPQKVKVVNFGPNIECERNFKDIDLLTDKKNFDICKLIFIGVDWYRKGGSKTLEIAQKLNQRGLRTELHIVGCDPPIELPSFVKNYGFLSKKNHQDIELLNNLMSESHFLILPSIAECAGVVFAEASSFGLPSITTNVGGTTSMVVDGKNGFTFELDEKNDKYCDVIEKLMNSKTQYKELSKSSFHEYSTRLNWKTAGNKVHNLILSQR